MTNSNPSQVKPTSTANTDRGAGADGDSGIEFGQIEQIQPAFGLRPDADKHFAVAMCGSVTENDLPIFVDMDVLRDMEAHARENTTVELGGVMLGRQHIDDHGRPFVTITDSLRAKHYEATKGSFKFTHETWSQITRERNEFASDLELVGWYHTHPGWGVFLSGMDLFICNNFFSRPLDVALVIEPCSGERGWFQWENGATRRTPGFFLMTNRHRQLELNYFSEVFRDPNPDIHDPRFRQASFGEISTSKGDEMVNVIDNRRPIFEFVMVSMLFLQFSLVAVLGYRMIGGGTGQDRDELAERVTQAENELAADTQRRETSIREQALSDLLDQIVSNQTGTEGLAEKFADLSLRNRQLSEQQTSQQAEIRLANNMNAKLDSEVKATTKLAAQLQEELEAAQKSVKALQAKNSKFKEQNAGDDTTYAYADWLPPWLIYSLAALACVSTGVIAGAWLTKRRLEEHEIDSKDSAESAEPVSAQSHGVDLHSPEPPPSGSTL